MASFECGTCGKTSEVTIVPGVATAWECPDECGARNEVEGKVEEHQKIVAPGTRDDEEAPVDATIVSDSDTGTSTSK